MRYWLFIVLFFISSSGFVSTGEKNTNNNNLIIKKLNKLETLLLNLKKNPRAVKVSAVQIRVSVQSVAWVFPKYFSITDIENINNAKYWTINDEIAQLNYPEAGAVQIIEKCLKKKEYKTKNLVESLDKILNFTQKFRQQITANPLQNEDIYPLIYLSLQEQYLLYLTGYYHTKTDEILPEIQHHLSNLTEYIDDKLLQDKVLGLQAFIKQNTFESLNRWEVYTNYYQPILRDLQVHFSDKIPVYLNKKIGQNFQETQIFSDNFFNTSFYTKSTQTVDSQMVNLGKTLFFDPLLSQNNKRACASCHKPQKAFSDGRQTSLGYHFSEKLNRNAPSLLNGIYNQYFSHDLAKKTLEEQILFVVHNPKEFNSRLDESVKKINQIPNYQKQFKTCFPDNPTVDSTNILKAIVTYMSTLKSFDSEVDVMMQKNQKIGENIQQGYNLFMGKAGCGSCHFAPLFSGLKPPFFSKNEYYKIIHPQINISDSDVGVAHNNNANHQGKRYEYFFKTPSLRNLKYTVPFMHDGTVISIKEAIALHTKPQKNQINSYHPTANLSVEEIDKIVLFLENLNTESLLKKYPEPTTLPQIEQKNSIVNKRRIGGVY